MTKPRASLFSVPAANAAPDEASEASAAAPVAIEPPARRSALAKTRAGKRSVTAYLDPEAFRQLKRIAVDEDADVQDLIREGLNAVFAKRGLSRIA